MSNTDSRPDILNITNPIIELEDCCIYYGKSQAIFNVSLGVPRNQVTALIGPSGCGKSTLLRSLNRMNDLIGSVKTTGSIKIEGQEINRAGTDVIDLRRSVGMVFQKSNPFPKTIFENVVYGLRIIGVRDRQQLEDVAERSLRGASLWDEVKDRLHESALGLSGGQMQRLCIARA
ncbi:MAG: ATP-binding cassette domain-containing protein, partial [Verrucomicrobia bacterium]|nr:ATP-binding cassette domain-containing protein [Verrucomicrobiota bacterium]